LGDTGRQRLHPPPPVSLALWVHMALEVAHHQGGVTGLRHLGDTGRQRLHPPPPVSLALWVHMALEVAHHQGGVTGLRHLGANGQQRFQPPPPVSLTVCMRMALEVGHHEGGVTGLGHLGAAGRQRLQPPPPVALTLWVGMALEVTHRQARGTSHRHLGAAGRQRWHPPCARLTRGGHAQCPRGHTLCAQSARRLGFNGIHPAPIRTLAPHPTATHHPHSTTGASDGIDPAGGSTGAAQADGNVPHATIPRAGACSCAMATPPRGRRERRCGAAGGGDAARSGTRCPCDRRD
jgi:hypothetical protein